MSSRTSAALVARGSVMDFIPDKCEADLIEGDSKLRLSFRRDDGESREVILPREWAPSFVAQLVSKIGPGQVTPIDPQGLQIGRSFAVQGWTVQKNLDGRRRIILFVDFPDEGRQVHIPFELSANEAQDLRSELA
jgi:hypothetical protein